MPLRGRRFRDSQYAAKAQISQALLPQVHRKAWTRSLCDLLIAMQLGRRIALLAHSIGIEKVVTAKAAIGLARLLLIETEILTTIADASMIGLATFGPRYRLVETCRGTLAL
jgi:hypothetical protein